VAGPSITSLPSLAFLLFFLFGRLKFNFFDNSQQSECIPLCVILHSVCEGCDRSRSKPIVLQKPSPKIVGVDHFKEKTDVNSFLSALFEEIKRLVPNNDVVTTIGRPFIVSIRYFIADLANTVVSKKSERTYRILEL
jgi:hypothetical protein